MRDDGCLGNMDKATHDCDNQGISPGCFDEYDINLPCQWIDITGLPDGPYILQITVNPLHTIAESNYTNNVLTISVDTRTLPWLNRDFTLFDMMVTVLEAVFFLSALALLIYCAVARRNVVANDQMFTHSRREHTH